MKTIRIQYLTKLDAVTDVKQFFDIKEGSLLKSTLSLLDDDFSPKEPNRHLHWIDDVTVDLLVPDDFSPATILGTIILSDGVDFKHEWMGNRDTPMVIDKQDNRQKPNKETDVRDTTPKEDGGKA